MDNRSHLLHRWGESPNLGKVNRLRQKNIMLFPHYAVRSPNNTGSDFLYTNSIHGQRRSQDAIPG